jgi:hypothetical protein
VNFGFWIGIGETVACGNTNLFFRIGPVGCGFYVLGFENRIFVRAWKLSKNWSGATREIVSIKVSRSVSCIRIEKFLRII